MADSAFSSFVSCLSVFCLLPFRLLSPAFSSSFPRFFFFHFPFFLLSLPVFSSSVQMTISDTDNPLSQFEGPNRVFLRKVIVDTSNEDIYKDFADRLSNYGSGY